MGTELQFLQDENSSREGWYEGWTIISMYLMPLDLKKV
jgi:hypothetical protein